MNATSNQVLKFDDEARGFKEYASLRTRPEGKRFDEKFAK